ncbi:MAG: metal ABC transporter substrate-binding protein [Thermodesulfovibrionales bacterium]|nr:metal ABC transporter substrate-binding protein [Thermodesulfovibrionales bacterium]
MKREIVVAFIIFICLLPVSPLYAGEIKIVVSIYPLSDITRQIGKDKVAVKTLLPAAASPHTFEPAPGQMAELQNARIFIKIGAGLEFWAEKVVKAVSNKNLSVVDLSSDMPLIRSVHAYGDNEKGSEHNHKNSSADPHFWLDPVLSKRIVDKIATVLTKIDPSNKHFYTTNAEEYKRQLDRLNADIVRRTSQLKTKEYVTFHSAWNYFSKRYGFKVIGVIEESPGREPSPGNIAKIINELRRLKARVIFAEPQFSPRVAETIAKEVGANVLLLDPLGSPDKPDRDTYIELMLYNLSQIERAMK